ncbi:MAG: hypothetical protein COV76_04575 [Candidatus Omnitrophica bacterium CG11_big_fil_rev_8_21_14_0_20_64_10]|nr:MAG: hypothetical protein COV76_04575 [Candidatus Omnitrophica bacterium CG11_big_fil_rev_8_21_14_0_20_64_10]
MKTAFIYIHGVQPIRPSVAGFSAPFHARMLRALRGRGVATTGIGRREVVWSDLTCGSKFRYIRRQFDRTPRVRRPIRFVTRAVEPIILDILFYVKNKGNTPQPGPMRVLERLHRAVCAVRARGARRLLIWAHSLGSVAAYDYVFRFRKRFALPRDLQVGGLITFGSPVPLFAAGMGYPFSVIRLPANVGRWLNFWDPDDPIACRCEPHFPPGVVTDIPVNTASPARPLAAHAGYWSRPAVIETMAEAAAPLLS